MNAKEAAGATREVVARLDPGELAATADALRVVWVKAVPEVAAGQKTMRDWGIDDPDYEAFGTPVPVLAAMGRELGKMARTRVSGYLPLIRLLWDEYGREGRIVAAVATGPMELVAPEMVVPVIYEMARTCVFWEDCDQLAMRALEPILRKEPENWLERLGLWVLDENKWVRRAGLMAIGRLPMKHKGLTHRCVNLAAPALGDPDMDVKRALSFALRLCARGEVAPVKAFIEERQDVTDADSLWVLCDVIRSMWKALLPDFSDLLPIYQDWLDKGEPKSRRSVAGAIRLLEGVR